MDKLLLKSTENKKLIKSLEEIKQNPMHFTILPNYKVIQFTGLIDYSLKDELQAFIDKHKNFNIVLEEIV